MIDPLTRMLSHLPHHGPSEGTTSGITVVNGVDGPVTRLVNAGFEPTEQQSRTQLIAELEAQQRARRGE